ncbi:MAG: methyltransferase domain-containing protein [Anaerolineae bacterium]|nr:methyltransferase domain-containing protein [Anaerolineae bacterium]
MGTLSTMRRKQTQRLAAALTQLGAEMGWSLTAWGGAADNRLGWPRDGYRTLPDLPSSALNPLRGLFSESTVPIDVLYIPSLTSVSLVGVVDPIPAVVAVMVPELAIPADFARAERFRLQANKLLSLASIVIVPSPALRDQLVREFALPLERIQVIAPPTVYRNEIAVALAHLACFDRAVGQRYQMRPRTRTRPMVSREQRVLYILNHTTLKNAEVPVIRALGLEIYASKLLSGQSGFRSGSVDYADNDESTLPRWVLAELDRHNFYDDPMTPAFAKLLNDHFSVVICTALTNLMTQLMLYFKGRIVVRAFGREAPLNYAQVFEAGQPDFWETLWRDLDRFWLGVGYDSITPHEPPMLQQTAITLPLTMPDTIYVEANTWIGSDPRVYFICPDIHSPGDYYGKIYREFKANFGHLPHVIGGRQVIPVDDPNVIGFVTDERMKQYFREMRVMFYHSREPRHLHYHPLEAIVYGMPLIYMNGGLLEHFARRPDLPGACDTYAEANAKLQRILAGDEAFTRAVIESQTVILEEFSPEFVRRTWRERFVGHILSHPLTPDVLPFGRWQPVPEVSSTTAPDMPLQQRRRILFYGRLRTGDAAYRRTAAWIDQVLRQTESSDWQIDLRWGAPTMTGTMPVWTAPTSDRLHVELIEATNNPQTGDPSIVVLPVHVDPNNPPPPPIEAPLPERASPPAAPYLTLDELYQMVEAYEVVCFPQPLGLLSPNLDPSLLTPLPIIVFISDLAHEYGDNIDQTTDPNTLSHELAIWSRLAQVMLFPSEAVRDDAVKRYAIPLERTRVGTLPALEADLARTPTMTNLPESYLLAAVDDPAQDNLDSMVAALSYLRWRGEQVPPLVLLGIGGRDALLTDQPDSHYHRWLQQIVRDGGLAVGKDIILLEATDALDLAALCSHTRLCLSVSRLGLDRYGLIETALRTRSPLLIGNTPFTQQYAGVALLEPPDDPVALGEAICYGLTNQADTTQRTDAGAAWIAQQTNPRLVQEIEHLAVARVRHYERPVMPVRRKASMASVQPPSTPQSVQAAQSIATTAPLSKQRSWLVRLNTFVVHSILPIFRLTSLNRYRRLENELQRFRVDYDAMTMEVLNLRAKAVTSTAPQSSIDLAAELKRLMQRVEGLEAQLTEKPSSLPLFIDASLTPPDDVAGLLAQMRMVTDISVRKDTFYTALETAFRGNDELIARRQEHYLPWLNSAQASEQRPILDIGCGRGEFLRLLRNANVACVGVDPNAEHIDTLRQQGFAVQQAGGLEYLEARAEASLMAITAFQVIEHMDLAYLERMLQCAMTTLVDGGQILLETVNPYCLATYRTFYIDPTHVRPLPIDLLSMLMWAAGFTDLHVFYQNPVLANAALEDGAEASAYETYALLGKRPKRA